MRRLVAPPLRLLDTVLDTVLDLVWPPVCAACGEAAWEGDGLCARCASFLPAAVPRCARCARPVGPYAVHSPCARCAEERSALDGVLTAYSYRGAARELVLGLKFRARFESAAVLGRALAAAVRDAEIPGDLIVPVPLSRRRRRARGYDQALLLAAEVHAALPIPWDPRALQRRRDTPPQTAVSRARRLRGPRGAFRARRSRVKGRCILLVDDVLTSGGTANACAMALRRAGACSVVAAVACRA